jgi:DNA mismatch repair protein MLH3
MWTDASTGERFFIDSRTGHTYCQSEYQPDHVEASTLSREKRLTFTLPEIDNLVPTKRAPHSGSGLVPAWLEQAFKVCLSFVLVSQTC